MGIIGHKGKNYWKYAETNGGIETKYIALGEHEVSYKEYDANDEIIGKYAVWYPDGLESSDNKYPVVVFANSDSRKRKQRQHFLS